MKIKEGGGMDLQKGREAFENHLKKMGKTDNETFSKNEDDSYQMDIIHFGWKIWQAAIARMEVRINTLDEMLLNQGEALAQAKAQAVPQWILTSERMPDEGEEVLVHSLGQVRQVTRDSKWAGGFKERNCYGWQAAYGQSHWMPKSIELPEQYHFYYENDAKQKAMIEPQEPAK